MKKDKIKCWKNWPRFVVSSKTGKTIKNTVACPKGFGWKCVKYIDEEPYILRCYGDTLLEAKKRAKNL